MLINWLGGFYLRLPKFSEELDLYIVKLLPFLALIFGVLITIASVFEILGTPFLSIFTLQGRGLPVIQLLLITNVLGIIQGLLMFFAVPSLNKRKLKGWRMLFWSQVVWIIASLLSISPSLLIALIIFYPFFQVKHHYN